MLSATVDPSLKAAIDTEADRRNVSRSQLVEALIHPGICQLLSGNYDVVLNGDGGLMLQRIPE